MATAQSQSIQKLKQKLHQSFLQISDIEKIYEGQLETQKQSYQSRIQEIQLQNQSLKKKIMELQKANKPCPQFFLDGLDQTKIQIQLNNNCASFILENSFTEFLKKGQHKNKRDQLIQLQQQISFKYRQIHAEMRQYFKLAHELYDENCILKEQLQKAQTKIENDIGKLQNIASMNQQLFKTSTKLKEDNKKLAQMYRQQILKNQQLQGTPSQRLKHTISFKGVSAKSNSNPSPDQNSAEKGLKKSLPIPSETKTFKSFMKKHASNNQT